MGKFKDLTGNRYGTLVVTEFCEMKEYKSCKKSTWYCTCDCGKINHKALGCHLTSGKITSCGCQRKDNISKALKGKQRYINEYNLEGEYGIGYTKDGEEFYFDIEDYNIIKDCCWNVHHGYVSSNAGENNKLMHRLITNCPKNKVVDHINRNKKDNRKSNLRVCSQSNNGKNKSPIENSVSGVCWDRKLNKWKVTLNCNEKRRYLGLYTCYEDAILKRLEAEIIFFKDFAPQLNLINEYGFKDKLQHLIDENLSLEIKQIHLLESN